MSADNPTRGSSENDKPVPAKPALPADGDATPRQRHMTMSRGEYARYVTSRPPIRRLETDTPGSAAPQPDHRDRPETHTTPSEGATDRNTGRRARVPDDAEPRPDVSDSGGIETVRESAPDQHLDDPRWDKVMSVLESLQARNQELERKVGSLEASYGARLEAMEARRQTEAREFKQEISDLKAKLEAAETRRADVPGHVPDSDEPTESTDVTEPEVLPDAPGVGDEVRNDGDQVGIADVNERLGNDADREDSRTAEKPKRAAFSEEDVELAKSVYGLAKSAGVTIPGADLVFGGDSTQRALEKMSPEDQSRIQTVGEMIGILVSGMSPEAAAAVVITSIVGPTMYAKAQDKTHDFLDKIRRKD